MLKPSRRQHDPHTAVNSPGDMFLAHAANLLHACSCILSATLAGRPPPTSSSAAYLLTLRTIYVPGQNSVRCPAPTAVRELTGSHAPLCTVGVLCTYPLKHLKVGASLPGRWRHIYAQFLVVFLSHQLSCLHRFYLLVRSVVHNQHHLSEQFGQFVALLPELPGEKPMIVAPGSSYSILHTCIAELGRKAVAERPNKAPRGKLASTAGVGVRARARESRVTESWRKGFRRPIGGMSTT